MCPVAWGIHIAHSGGVEVLRSLYGAATQHFPKLGSINTSYLISCYLSPWAGCRARPRLWTASPASTSAPSASTSPRRTTRSPGSRRWSRRSRRRSPCSRGKFPRSPRRWTQCNLTTGSGISLVFALWFQWQMGGYTGCLTNSKSWVTVHGLHDLHSLGEEKRVVNEEVFANYETNILGFIAIYLRCIAHLVLSDSLKLQLDEHVL